MSLTFFNTATRRKEVFKPADPAGKQVKMYACGPTVYDYFHVGNARAFVVFDILRRLLERRGYAVTYVQNITDVDDKIINRAAREGRQAQEVAQTYTAAFFEDLQALGCRPADMHPKATAHIPEIIALVEKLLQTKHAYPVEGDVYFAVRTFKGYGKLSGKKISELEKGARVEVDPRKRDPLDFALWKAAKPGEPSWPSPWGPGRPGWHIECSAMSMKYLGETFDIHGGGEDLIFPHHENENAQSEAVTGKPLARYWLHNGFLKIEGEKMSKSLGNFRVVRDILKSVPRAVLRLFLLSAHYRSPLDFNPENIGALQKGYEELARTLMRMKEILRLLPQDAHGASEDPEARALERESREAVQRFEANLDDDLNTAQALGQIFSLANRLKQLIAGRTFDLTQERVRALRATQEALWDMSGVLGVAPEIPNIPPDILAAVKAREAARAEKNWAEADRLRETIRHAGWLVDDTFLGPLATPDNILALVPEQVS